MLCMVSRMESSAAMKASRERVRRFLPIEAMSRSIEDAETGWARRSERCSRHWKFARARRASSVRRKHFLSLRRLRMGQPWTRYVIVSLSNE